MVRRYRKLAVFALLVLTLFFFRNSLIRGIGTWLDAGEDPEKVQAVYVLAGGPQERGQYAAKLYHAGYAPLLICTGEIVPPVLELMGDTVPEADITRQQLLLSKVPDRAIARVYLGTSTYEEGMNILLHAHSRGYNKIAVVSSSLHTRRIHLVLQRHARLLGIACLVLSAPPGNYEVDKWYKSEEGLLFVVNEYLKLAYYLYKY